jgi:hypothetical protein
MQRFAHSAALITLTLISDVISRLAKNAILMSFYSFLASSYDSGGSSAVLVTKLLILV